MSEILLSKIQGYQAMFYFLEGLYSRTNDSTLGEFLGSMQILKDGKPADSALWSDWEEAIEKAVTNTSY